MRLIDDDPIVRSLECWGMPPWLITGVIFEDDEQEEFDDAEI